MSSVIAREKREAFAHGNVSDEAIPSFRDRTSARYPEFREITSGFRIVASLRPE